MSAIGFQLGSISVDLNARAILVRLWWRLLFTKVHGYNYDVINVYETVFIQVAASISASQGNDYSYKVKNVYNAVFVYVTNTIKRI